MGNTKFIQIEQTEQNYKCEVTGLLYKITKENQNSYRFICTSDINKGNYATKYKKDVVHLEKEG